MNENKIDSRSFLRWNINEKKTNLKYVNTIFWNDHFFVYSEILHFETRKSKKFTFSVSSMFESPKNWINLSIFLFILWDSSLMTRKHCQLTLIIFITQLHEGQASVCFSSKHRRHMLCPQCKTIGFLDSKSKLCWHFSQIILDQLNCLFCFMILSIKFNK